MQARRPTKQFEVVFPDWERAREPVHRLVALRDVSISLRGSVPLPSKAQTCRKRGNTFADKFVHRQYTAYL